MRAVSLLVVSVATLVLGDLMVAPSAKSGAGAPGLVVEEFSIDSADPGIRLFVRNKRPAGQQSFGAERTLLFVHGASQPAEATFDLSLDGLSWMDFIARRGWDVYLVDLRGYGRSTRPPEMDRPPEESSPIVRTDVAARDVGAAVDFVLQRRAIPRLSLLGWSWGTTLVGGYAAEHPDRVERLVLYAALWLGEGIPAPTGAYLAAPMEVARQRLQAGAPDDEKEALLPTEWFEAWKAEALASDPVGAAQNPPVLRSPAGVRQDLHEFWSAGKSTYDPSAISAPTLLVTGAWDQVTPPEQAQGVFDELGSATKRFVQVGAATHLLMLEKNREQLFQEVQLFLEADLPH
ncbi:MAG: alpha/beta hydrolase [Geminicoccaceae bacterium]